MGNPETPWIGRQGHVYLRCVRFCLLPLLCLALAGCGGEHRTSNHVGGTIGGTASLECAPFARALTGVHLAGAAAGWWSQADGHYAKTHVPDIGSILVFRPAGRMPSGHVAVVSEVVSQRRILVTHANWMPHRVTEDQPVVDVSAAGDWSEVQVWWPPSEQLGITGYRTFGFIHPDNPVDRTTIVATTPAAIRTALAAR